VIPIEVLKRLKQHCEEITHQNKKAKKLAREMTKTRTPTGIYWGNKILEILASPARIHNVGDSND